MGKDKDINFSTLDILQEELAKKANSKEAHDFQDVMNRLEKKRKIEAMKPITMPDGPWNWEDDDVISYIAEIKEKLRINDIVIQKLKERIDQLEKKVY